MSQTVRPSLFRNHLRNLFRPGSGARRLCEPPEALEQRIAPANFTVSNVGDGGAGSFRQAIIDANATPGSDVIDFNIPSGPFVIQPLTPLPDITEAVLIDGYSQPGTQKNTDSLGTNAQLLIELDVSQIGSGQGLTLAGTGGSTVTGLVIYGTTNSINGSGNGILIHSNDNVVAGNFIGTDVSGLNLGAQPLGIANAGVRVDLFLGQATYTGNVIGGFAPEDRNLLSGNLFGVALADASVGTLVVGNLIGTDATGLNPLGNGRRGVTVNGDGNVIGSPLPGGTNVISGNQEEGIGIFSDSNIIQGNLIGVAADGVTPMPNDFSGITLDSAFGNVIGGSGLGEGNVISANAFIGIAIGGQEGTYADSTTIQGNLIGTDITGTVAIGNGGAGINISAGSLTTIGGVGAGEGNVIAHNGSDGVVIIFGTGNEVSGNSIVDNAGLGIRLADFRGASVTQNDPFDTDNGPNGLQNYPVLATFSNTGTNITLDGVLPSKANTDYRLEFFAVSKAQADPSRFGEGALSLGSVNVTTDASGNATFNFSQAIALPPDTFFTATATAITAKDTSEFSEAIGPVDTFTWQGGVSTDWFDPANWSPNGVPGAFDVAIFNGGAPNDLELNQNTTVGTFQHTAGNFFGTGTLSVGDSLTWTGGSQTGPGLDVIFTAVGTIGGGAGPVLWDGGVLATAGLITINGQGVIFNSGSLIQSGDLFLDAGLIDADGPSSPTSAFNHGTITKRGAGAFGFQNMSLDNDGLVVSTNGTLALGSYVSSQSVQSFSGATSILRLAGGDVSATGGFDHSSGVIEGSGQLIGDVNVPDGAILPGGPGAIGALTIVGNYAQFADNEFSLAGELQIDVAGLNSGEFDTLTVTGAVTLDGDLLVHEIGGFQVPLFARIDVLSAASVNGAFQFTSLPTKALVQYTPTTVAVQTPPLNTYTWTGAVSSDWLDGANWSGGVVPGPNDKGILPATALPNQPNLGDNVAIGLFEQQGGSLSGPGELMVNFEFLWTGGTQTGASSTIIPGGSSFIADGAATKSLDGRLLVIDPGAVGLIDGTGGIAIGNNASLDISGEVTITGDADFISGAGVGAIYVEAQGSLAKTAGGTTDVAASLSLQNAGDLRVDASTLNFLGNVSQSGGRTIIASGAILGSTLGFALDGGSLRGHGTVAGSVNQNGGTIAPGDAPRIQISVDEIPGIGGTSIDGFQSYSYGSSSVSILGDVNGDGFVDFIVGAPHDDNVTYNGGAAYVVFGTGSPLGPNFNVNTIDGTNGFLLFGSKYSERAGTSVASAGDFNGDGFTDIIIGAPGYDGYSYNAGIAYIVFGKATFPASVDLGALDGTDGVKLPGVSNYAYTGTSVSSAGDFNGDGLDDVIIGAPRAGTVSTYEGAAYVVFGRMSSPATIDLAALNGNDGFVILGAAGGDRTGEAVGGGGDFNGDGFADVIVGAPRGSYSVGYERGAAYVVFGRPGSAALARFSLTTIDGTNGVELTGGGADSYLGASVNFVGDLNGDGLDDVAVGAPHDGEYGSPAAYVVFGSNAGLPSLIDVRALSGTDGFRISGLRPILDAPNLPLSAAGDFNGDGFGDLILGAPGTDRYTGEAYVIYGRPDFSSIIDTSAIDGANGLRIVGSESGQTVALAVSGGADLDGDGFGDVLIGSSIGYAGTALIVPGASPTSIGILTIDGGLIQGPSGTLEIEIGGTTVGTEYDQLIVTGTAGIGGALEAVLVNGFSTVFPDQFDVLTTSGGVSGSFAVENVPSDLTTTYSANTVSLVNNNGPLVYIWDGEAGNDWFNPINWDRNSGVPGAIDTAILDISAQINLNSPATVGTFEMSAGTLFSFTTLTVLNSFDWSGGILQALIETSPGSISTVSGASAKSILGGTGGGLRNQGALSFTSTGTLDFQNGAFFSNEFGSSFDLLSDINLTHTGGGGSFFGVAGTFTKTGGAGTSSFGTTDMAITGPFSVQSGDVMITSTLSTGTAVGPNGSFATGAGTSITFAGNSVLTNTVFSGAGTKRFTGPTVNLAGNIQAGGFEIASGTWTGTSTISGTLNWTGGTLQGAPTFDSSATLNIAGPTLKMIAGSGGFNGIVNQGTVIWSGTGDLQIENGGFVDNQVGALFNIINDAQIVQTGGGVSNFINGGTVRKAGGIGTTPFSIGGFTNTGAVDVQTGSVFLNGGVSTGSALGPNGTFNAGTGASITFAGNSVFTNTVFSGTGTKRFTGPTASLAGNIDAGGFEIASGTWTGTSTISGTLNWTGGTLQGAPTFDSSATLNIAGPTLKMIAGSGGFNGIVNQGTVIWSGTGDLQIENGGFVDNQVGAIFEARADASIIQNGGGVSNFANGGTFIRNTGTGTATVALGNFSNAGSVRSESGTLAFDIAFNQTAGSTLLNGGNLATNGTLLFNGGTLSGFGTIAGNVGNTGASVQPGGNGGAGTLTVTGNYSQGAGGMLAIEVAGTGAGQFDVLAVGGTATVGGILDATLLAGFTPPNNSQFQVITAAPRSGSFATENLPPGLTAQYNPNNVTLLGPVVFDPLMVTTTADTIDPQDGVTSLREAIEFANNNPGLDTITFNIPGGGVQTIALSSALPSVIDAVVIDGFTQPGSAVNSSTTSDNAVRNIVINGGGDNFGLIVQADGATIRGLALTGFIGTALSIQGQNAIVVGNDISNNAGAGIGNFASGALPGPGTIIGGTTPADRNLINANASAGIVFSGGSGSVFGNFIGVAADGLTADGNSGSGIDLQDTFSISIGGIAPGAGNIIAFNNGDGITLSNGEGDGSGISIRGNSIFSNSGLGIDLGGDGVTANDPGDGDTGENGLQNFPVIGTAFGTVVAGTFNSTASATFTIDFYANSAADPSGFGEGQIYLGSSTVTTDAGGDATFFFVPTVAPAVGSFVSATATSAGGDTSEFSQAVVVAAPPVFVWDGSEGDQDWFNPANWNVNAVPGPADTAILDITSTINLTADAVVSNFTQSAGTFTGPATFTVLSSFDWTAGTQSGSGITLLELGGTLNLSGSASKMMDRDLLVLGSTNWNDTGDITAGQGATFSNQGDFIILGDVSFLTGGGAIPTFVNQGTLTKTGGLGPAIFASAFDNSGTVNVNSGQMEFTGGGTSSGTLNVVANAGVEFGGGMHVYDGSSSISGAGTVIFSGGSVDIGGGYTVTGPTQINGGTANFNVATSIPSLDLSAGALGGTGAIAITSDLTWTGGQQIGTGATTIASSASLDISGIEAKTLTRTLNNDGAATWSEMGDIDDAQSGALINNSGSFSIQPAGSFAFTGNFANAGTIAILSGEVIFGQSFTQTAGLTNLSGGNVQFGQTASFNGGELIGDGTISGSISNSGATIRPGGSGAAGTLTLTGDYTQIAGGILDVEIGGSTAGTTYDQLVIGGTATLGGTMTAAFINGFTPTAGDIFTVLTSSIRTGTFATVNAPAPLLANYTPTDAQLVAPGPLPPTIVTTPLDVVDANDGLVSFREAILFANANPGLDTITFNIPGAGVQNIAVLAPLPTITDGLIIDGYSQPGASPNTLAFGSNAVLLVQLSNGGNSGSGLVIGASGVTVRGLSLTGFDDSLGGAIVIQSAGSGAIVTGNFIGIDPSGTSTPNVHGVYVANASGVTIGGAAPADRNVISGNSGDGIWIVGSGGTDNVVQGNLIGTDVSGAGALGNGYGVLLQSGDFVQAGPSNNLIGGTNPGEGNVIAFNTNAGVTILGPSRGNLVLGNSIHDNSGLGIDLNGDGITPNDLDDSDTGPNDLINFPVITNAIATGNGVDVSGTFTVASNGMVRLEFFRADASGEGQTFLGATDVMAVAGTPVAFNITLAGALAPGDQIVATASDSAPGASGTSEFSAPAIVVPPVLVSVGDAILVEGDSGTRQLVFTFSLNQTSNVPVTVTFTTAPFSLDGRSATADVDYQSITSTITFPPNTLTQTHAVTIIGDTVAEPRERFNVVLSNPMNALLGRDTGVGVIQDDDHHFIAAASGKGNSFTVLTVGPSGASELVTVQAFGKNFKGGVRVAVGDINGDGIDDFIAGGGSNSGGRVRVFDGATITSAEPTVLQDFVAFGAYRGGVFVAAGDINLDGIADIIVSPSAGSLNTVRVFDGANGNLISEFRPFGRGGGGVRVAAGDVNGDGQIDIIAGAGTGSGVAVFDGLAGFPLLGPDFAFRAFGKQFRGGVYVSAGDVNFDGIDDIIVGAGLDSATVRIFPQGSEDNRGSFEAYGRKLSGVRVATADINGDGIADIITAKGRGADNTVTFFDGAGDDPFFDFKLKGPKSKGFYVG